MGIYVVKPSEFKTGSASDNIECFFLDSSSDLRA